MLLRLRRHNRLLHGWGIVCGAGVTPGADSQTVVVGAGLVLDPWGNEIWLETDVVVDLCHADLAGNLIASVAGTALPAWTTTAVRAGGDVVHLAVRHLETNTNPVRIPGREFTVRIPAPAVGEHTDEVLAELGYTAAEIEDFHGAGTG